MFLYISNQKAFTPIFSKGGIQMSQRGVCIDEEGEPCEFFEGSRSEKPCLNCEKKLGYQERYPVSLTYRGDAGYSNGRQEYRCILGAF